MRAINGVQLKEAESTEEKKILGIIADAAQNCEYGTITLEIQIRAGKLTRATKIESTSSIVLDK